MNSSTLHLLHRVHQCAGELFQQHMDGIDITTTQYTVLRAASQKDGLSQQDIINATGIDRSTVSQVVQLLTRKGLLKRKRTRHDARAYAISLTEAGRDVLKKSEPIMGRIEQELVAALPATRAKTFVSNLRAIVAAFEPVET
ncbi:MarR family winged helix-turn-helix transcriptional regulator [Hyphomicrobium sulfonivorans]